MCDHTVQLKCKLEAGMQEPRHRMAKQPIDMPRTEISASDLAIIAGNSRFTHAWDLLEPVLKATFPDRHRLFVQRHPMAPSDPRLDEYLQTCQEPLKSLVKQYVSIARNCAQSPQLVADQIEAVPEWIARQNLDAEQGSMLSRLMATEIRCAYGKIAENSYLTLLEACPILPDTDWQRSHLNRFCVIAFSSTDHEVKLWGTPDMVSEKASVVVEIKSRVGSRLKRDATSRAIVQTDAYLWTHDAQTAYLAEFVYCAGSAHNEVTLLRGGAKIDGCVMRPSGSDQVYTQGSTQVTCRTRADADSAFRTVYGPRLLSFCRVFHKFAVDEAWQTAFAEATDKEEWYVAACKTFR